MKLEEGFSGDGNAIFDYDGAPGGPALAPWVRRALSTRLRCVASGETWTHYREQFARLGGIVEAFVEGAEVRSPSVQCRIDPQGDPQLISTHDQVLGGATGQIYVGCTFPAEAACCPGLHEAARRVARVLAEQGVVGRFGIDFLSTRQGGAWTHHAIEINLRKGGTTHPYLTLQLLTGGTYDADAACYRSATGQPCHYVASDNVCHPAYAAVTPDALIDAAARAGLHYDPRTERGVVFHLFGTLREHGKVGAVCIAHTPEGADRLFEDTVALLDRLSGRRVARARDAASPEAAAPRTAAAPRLRWRRASAEP